MIGYILLITAAVVMSIIIYQWMKTYIPKEPLKCPDGVSIFIEEANYDGNESLLNLTLKNNGRFNIAGYFIHATNSSDQELATIDLSNHTELGKNKGGTVLFSVENSFAPNEKRKNIFNLSATGFGQIYSVEITPVRFQEEENKIRFVSCGDSKVKERVTYLGACVADESCKTITCVGSTCTDGCGNIYGGTLGPDDCGARVCGPAPNGCGDSEYCGTCTGVGEVCNIIEGTCIFCTPDCSSCAPDTCDDETCIEDNCNTTCDGTKAPDCGARVCGPAPNGCGNETVCGPCDGTCVDGVCVVSSCDGVWSPPEDLGVECDGGANCIAQGEVNECTCEEEYIPDGNGGCTVPSTVTDCSDWCVFIGNREEIDDYTGGICAQNPGKCDDFTGSGLWVQIDELDIDGEPGGQPVCGVEGIDDECDGDEYCIAGPQSNYCCCTI